MPEVCSLIFLHLIAVVINGVGSGRSTSGVLVSFSHLGVENFLAAFSNVPKHGNKRGSATDAILSRSLGNVLTCVMFTA